MIIGINGKIGSGKDTVGKIIQWLTKPELDGSYIGFQTYDDITLDRVSDWKIKKFAGKLKEIASLLTGIDIEDFEDQEFKKSHLGSEWGKLSVNNPLLAIEPFEKFQFWELMSVREFLQKLGTEAMREGLHTNVWVNALFADYKAIERIPEKRMSIMPNWIITDMRFPNEMEAVVEKGGITIRVVRPGTAVGTHPSEIALDGHIMHYEIINDGTIEDLIEKVREILTKQGIL